MERCLGECRGRIVEWKKFFNGLTDFYAIEAFLDQSDNWNTSLDGFVPFAEIGKLGQFAAGIKNR